jgi:probable HAF family extracellular repeat protein
MARAVNENGDVVGGSGTPYPNENYRPFLYHEGSMSQLMDVIGTAFDINENGQVVLGTWAGNFLWENGQTTELQFNGIPYAINNHGEIAAWAIGATPDVVGPSEFACRIVDGQVENLNDYVTGTGWDLTVAYDINDEGEIVGVGEYNGQGHGFLLTPDTAQHMHLGSPKLAEIYAKILFGVTKDGGGVVLIGGHPVPIDPWGPFWSSFSRSHPDAVTALAIAGTAAQLGDASARTAIQQEALGVIAKATKAP